MTNEKTMCAKDSKRKRRHKPRKTGHVHKAHFGEVRQAKNKQVWHGFNLQPGMYYGEDDEGLWATYGIKAKTDKGEFGLVMYRAERSEYESDDVYRTAPHEACIVWNKAVEASSTTRDILRIMTTSHKSNKASRKKMQEALVGRKGSDSDLVPVALNVLGEEHRNEQKDFAESASRIEQQKESAFKAASAAIKGCTIVPAPASRIWKDEYGYTYKDHTTAVTEGSNLYWYVMIEDVKSSTIVHEEMFRAL